MCMSHPRFERYSHFGKTGAHHSSLSLNSYQLSWIIMLGISHDREKYYRLFDKTCTILPS